MHYEALPVNKPKPAVNTNHADGSLRFDAPKGTDAYDKPNSFNGPVEAPAPRNRRCASTTTTASLATCSA